jgi:hypothetical protein
VRRAAPPLTVRRLLVRLARITRLADRVEASADRFEASADRFDQWESCLRWQPITSAGEPEQELGYIITGSGSPSPTWGSALDLDHSEWDDPAYEFLSFGGRDRPFGRGECGGEPGESVDRPPLRSARRLPRGVDIDGDLQDLRHGVADLQEDLEDLVEPVEEVTQFDECMFTVGARWLPGYEYLTSSGDRTTRTALSYHLRGTRAPELNLLAFPGEEPPQIECHEDAGGENIDE